MQEGGEVGEERGEFGGVRFGEYVEGRDGGGGGEEEARGSAYQSLHWRTDFELSQ